MDLIDERIDTSKPFAGAEIGVFLGATSSNLLHRYRNLHLFMVDPWRVPDQDSDYALSGDNCSRQTQQQHNENKSLALNITAFANDRRTVIELPSDEAAESFCRCGGSLLDLLFIDDDHSYSGVLRSLNAWIPKVRSGGVKSGHDYNRVDVKCAVDDYAREHGYTVHVGNHAVWWYE